MNRVVFASEKLSSYKTAHYAEKEISLDRFVEEKKDSLQVNEILVVQAKFLFNQDLQLLHRIESESLRLEENFGDFWFVDISPDVWSIQANGALFTEYIIYVFPIGVPWFLNVEF